MLVAKTIKLSPKLRTKALLLIPEGTNRQPDKKLGVKDLVENYARELLKYDTIALFAYHETIKVVRNQAKEGDWKVVRALGADIGNLLESLLKDSKSFNGFKAFLFDGNWQSELVVKPSPREYFQEKRKTGLAMVRLGSILEGVIKNMKSIKWRVPKSTNGIKELCQRLVDAISKHIEGAKSTSNEENITWTNEGKTPIIRMKEVSLHYKSLEEDYKKGIEKVEEWLTKDLEEALAKSLTEFGSEPARRGWPIDEIIITISGLPQPNLAEEGSVTSVYIERAKVGKDNSLVYVFFVPTVEQINQKELRVNEIWVNVVILLGSNIEVDENKNLIYSMKIRNLEKNAEDNHYQDLEAKAIIYPNIDKIDREERLLYSGIKERIENFYSQANFSSYYNHRWSLKYKGGNLFSYEKSVIRRKDGKGNLYVSNIESDFAKVLPMIKYYLKENIFLNLKSSPFDNRSTTRVDTMASKERISISDLVLSVNSDQLGEVARELIEMLESQRKRGGGEEDQEEKRRVKVLGGERIAQSILNYLGEVGSVPELCPPGEGKPLGFYEGNKQGIALEPLGWYEIIKGALENGEAVFHIGPYSFDAISVREYAFIDDPEKRRKEALVRFLCGLEKSEIEKAKEVLELVTRIEMERFVELAERKQGEYEVLPEKLAIKSANLRIKIESEDEKWVLAAYM